MIEWFFNYSTCSPCTDLLRSLAVTFWKNLLKWVNFFGDKFYGGKCNFTGGWGVIFLGSDCSGAIIQTAIIWEDGEGAIFLRGNCPRITNRHFNMKQQSMNNKNWTHRQQKPSPPSYSNKIVKNKKLRQAFLAKWKISLNFLTISWDIDPWLSNSFTLSKNIWSFFLKRAMECHEYPQ